MRVGVDTGGTFTDLVGIDQETGRLVLSKRPSTPDQPEQAVLDGQFSFTNRHRCLGWLFAGENEMVRGLQFASVATLKR